MQKDPEKVRASENERVYERVIHKEFPQSEGEGVAREKVKKLIIVQNCDQSIENELKRREKEVTVESKTDMRRVYGSHDYGYLLEQL